MTLGIYCAGGLGREVLELARQIGGFDTIVFVDDGETAKKVNDVLVLPFRTFCEMYPPEQARFVIATGEPALRCFLRKKVNAAEYGLQTLTHPSVLIPGSCHIGDGCILLMQVVLTENVSIDENVLLYPQSILTHDSVVCGDCSIMSGVRLSGHVRVGRGSFIGVSVSVRDERTIGAHCIIGMGSIVLSDIPDYSLAYGNPAKVMGSVAENQMVF